MSLTTSPNSHLLNKLLFIVDALRRKSVKDNEKSNKQKVTKLTVRQSSAIRLLKLLTDRNPEGVSLKTLSAGLQMTVPATSILVDTMVVRGYFERRPNPEDRRAVHIRLTEKGKGVFSELSTKIAKDFRNILMELEDEEKKNFAQIVEKLYSGINTPSPDNGNDTKAV